MREMEGERISLLLLFSSSTMQRGQWSGEAVEERDEAVLSSFHMFFLSMALSPQTYNITDFD